jgi:hypothetical protein
MIPSAEIGDAIYAGSRHSPCECVMEAWVSSLAQAHIQRSFCVVSGKTPGIDGTLPNSG